MPVAPANNTPPCSLCAVFFDLDGTLIDSLPDLVQAANALRREYHLEPLSSATITGFVGDGVRTLAGRALTGRREFSFPDNTLDQLHHQFIVHYEQCLTDKTICYPGVVETLGKLHEQDIMLALISNKPEQLVKKLLAFFCLTSFFRIILGGDSLERKKPHPLPLQEAASRLEVPIEAILMVGDSRNDLLAGKAAGSKTCLVDFGYDNAAELCQSDATRPDFCIGHLSELLKLIR